MKWLLKIIQQKLCSHGTVMMKHGATNKSGWDHFHKVTCKFCEKIWHRKGKELYEEHWITVDCLCEYRK